MRVSSKQYRFRAARRIRYTLYSQRVLAILDLLSAKAARAGVV